MTQIDLSPPQTPSTTLDEPFTEQDSGETTEERLSDPQTLLSYVSTLPGAKSPLPKEWAEVINELESALNMPVWMLVQPQQGIYSELDGRLRKALYMQRHYLSAGQPIALVLDSPGGYARDAYQIATFLRRRCGGFVAVIPRYAKSAATLLAAGADKIVMGPDAELGPLDPQLFDMDTEDFSSALDEVQALERLNVAALEQFDQAMMMMAQRTQKKVETLLPHALKFTSDMMRPLFEKLDTVHYIKQSRILKVAEDYATRLMLPVYGQSRSLKIANQLVNNYPEHAFVIDREEACEIFGFDLPTDDLDSTLDKFAEVLTTRATTAGAVGRVYHEHINHEKENEDVG